MHTPPARTARIASLAIALLAALPAAAADLGDILPLGDSITLGVPVSGGYRDPLMRSLTNAGFTFRFVGTQNGYATAELSGWTQQWHEGHSGFIIDGRNLYCAPPTRSGLYENMAAWLASSSPSGILLMIGSNDINLDYCSTNAPDRLSALIDLIANPTNGLEPAARLYVGSLIPMNTSTGTEPRVQAFNTALPGIVAAHQSNGAHVVLVNLHDALTFADLGDALHPNASGYQKMADAWFTALTGLTSAPPPHHAFTSSSPAIVVSGTNVAMATDNSATAGYATASAFLPQISAADLVDTNGAALAGWSRDKAPVFETTTLNDGLGHPTNASLGSFLPATYGAGNKLPFTYTFTLNEAAHPGGYDLTQVRSFAGWSQNGAQLGNQKLELWVRRVNEAVFSSLGTFGYMPFSAGRPEQASATMMTLSSTGAALAVNVAEVRLVLLDHGYKHASYSVDGTVYHEVDVLGAPSTNAPPAAAVALSGALAAAETDNSAAAGYAAASAFLPQISAADLIDTNSATLAGWSRDKAPVFESTTLNDGRSHPTNAAAGSYLPATFGGSGKLPFTYTFLLNTNLSPAGYDIASVRTFAGWNQNGAQLANQKYELLVRPAGTTAFVSLGIFTYAPFASTNTEEAGATMVTLTPGAGLLLATGADQVRFVFLDHGFKRSGVDGTVYFEADVFGQPTLLDPPPALALAPGVLRWPSAYPSFRVERTGQLAGGAWEDAGAAAVVVGTNIEAAVTPDPAASYRYYRLAR